MALAKIPSFTYHCRMITETAAITTARQSRRATRPSAAELRQRRNERWQHRYRRIARDWSLPPKVRERLLSRRLVDVSGAAEIAGPGTVAATLIAARYDHSEFNRPPTHPLMYPDPDARRGNTLYVEAGRVVQWLVFERMTHRICPETGDVQRNAHLMQSGRARGRGRNPDIAHRPIPQDLDDRA